jgi:hypothetical protein
MTNEEKLEFLEKCEEIADLLIPGDPSHGLIGLSQIIKVKLVEEPDFQVLMKIFIKEIEEFLGHEIGSKEINFEILNQHMNNIRGNIRLFLLKIIEIYYTDERVLQFTRIFPEIFSQIIGLYLQSKLKC